MSIILGSRRDYNILELPVKRLSALLSFWWQISIEIIVFVYFKMRLNIGLGGHITGTRGDKIYPLEHTTCKPTRFKCMHFTTPCCSFSFTVLIVTWSVVVPEQNRTVSSRYDVRVFCPLTSFFHEKSTTKSHAADTSSMCYSPYCYTSQLLYRIVGRNVGSIPINRI
jgi:hypothetical protein